MALLKDRLVSFITENLKKEVWDSLDENIREAYKSSHIDASKLVNIDPTRMRAQNRRYYTDNAIAGIYASVESKVHSTKPKGELYVVLQSGNITLSHIELHKNSLARKAKHRELLTKKNAIFESTQFDVFTDYDAQKLEAEQLDKALHIVVVIVHPEQGSKEQEIPFDILVTVPYTTWDDYHLKIPLVELIQKYESTEIPPTSITDRAWPTLREDLESEEKPSNKTG